MHDAVDTVLLCARLMLAACLNWQGQVVYYAHILLTLMGMRKRVQQVLSAASLEVLGP